MEDIVHLGESSQCPSTQVPADVEAEFVSDFLDDQVPVSFRASAGMGVLRGRGRSGTGQASPVSS